MYFYVRSRSINFCLASFESDLPLIWGPRWLASWSPSQEFVALSSCCIYKGKLLRKGQYHPSKLCPCRFITMNSLNAYPSIAHVNTNNKPRLVLISLRNPLDKMVHQRHISTQTPVQQIEQSTIRDKAHVSDRITLYQCMVSPPIEIHWYSRYQLKTYKEILGLLGMNCVSDWVSDFVTNDQLLKFVVGQFQVSSRIILS